MIGQTPGYCETPKPGRLCVILVPQKNGKGIHWKLGRLSPQLRQALLRFCHFALQRIACAFMLPICMGNTGRVLTGIEHGQ